MTEKLTEVKMDMVICRKCGEQFSSDDLITLHKLNTSHPYPNPSGHTPIMVFDGVVSPCCHALWDYVDQRKN